MKDKVFIAGSNGQLGSDCVTEFSHAAETLGIDRPILDLSDQQQVNDCLDNFKPNILINCAAYTAVDQCESDSSCWEINVNIPKWLSLWAEKNRAFLIHVSTDYVFDGEKEVNEFWLETDSPNPISEYGRSKLEGERVIQDIMSNYTILRTSWLYGRYGSNFLKTVLKKTAGDGLIKPMKIVDDQYGSPTWTHTLVKQMQLLIEKPLTGIIHASSEGYCSWYKLAVEFSKYMGIEPRIVPCTTNEYQTCAIRPKNSILENGRLKQEGINCFVDWKKELKNFVNNNYDILKNECGDLV